MKISRVTAREILDSRGNPTVAASVELFDGIIAEASVPSGASTGSRESKELRDGGKRYGGLGELKAVQNIEEIIAPAVVGMEVENQSAIDDLMVALDGTPKKERLGANAILAVSLAVSRAAALSRNLELYEYLALLFKNSKKLTLPTPMFNILNGGKHAENSVDIQETMIVPVGLKSFSAKLEAGSEIYHNLKNKLVFNGYEVGLGDEGGFAPELKQNEEVFRLVSEAIKDAGYGDREVKISIDVAASELWDGENRKYRLKGDKKLLSPEAMIDLEKKWGKKYQLLSVEDGLGEEDIAWKKLTKTLTPTFTVGDDLFTTDAEKIELGIKEKMAGGVIIKPNQIGTLTETMSAIKAAQKGKIKVIVSHRSGETEDSFIADLAVAVGADFIKAGAPARSERLAKYNRLTKIESILDSNNK